jgi:hypothetical protein
VAPSRLSKPEPAADWVSLTARSTLACRSLALLRASVDFDESPSVRETPDRQGLTRHAVAEVDDSRAKDACLDEFEIHPTLALGKERNATAHQHRARPWHGIRRSHPNAAASAARAAPPIAMSPSPGSARKPLDLLCQPRTDRPREATPGGNRQEPALSRLAATYRVLGRSPGNNRHVIDNISAYFLVFVGHPTNDT